MIHRISEVLAHGGVGGLAVIDGSILRQTVMQRYLAASTGW